MKRLALSFVAVVVVMVVFGIGIFSGQTGFSVAGFCLWSPAVWFFGWSFAKAGIRISVATSEPPVVRKTDIADIARRQSRLEPLK